MNKQEAIKKTEETVLRNISVTYQGEKETWYIDGVETPKDEVVEFISPNKAIIEAPDTSELVFKHEDEEAYCVVNNTGGVGREFNKLGYVHDVSRISIGNCFRTEEDAKNSAKYYIMNSEYDYYFPWTGQPKPKVLPKGLEYWSSEYHCFKECKQVSLDHIGSNPVYRWKRELQ